MNEHLWIIYGYNPRAEEMAYRCKKCGALASKNSILRSSGKPLCLRRVFSVSITGVVIVK